MLGRKQQKYQWFGVGMVVVGTIIVGAAPYVAPPLGTFGGTADSGASNPALGNAIIVLAQIVVGVQMCWEEKYVTEYNIPALLVVGWEGFFGLFGIHLLITVVHQFHDFSVGEAITSVDLPVDGSWHAPEANTDVRVAEGTGWGGGNANTVFWFGEDDAFKQFGAGSPNNPTLILAMVSKS